MNKNTKYNLILITSSFCWGLMYIFIKKIDNQIHPLNIALARYLIGGSLFLPFVIFKLKKNDKKDLLPLTIIFSLNGTLATILNVWATTLSTASNASIIINSNPMFIMFFAPWLIKKK